jgi:hypothetical protein
MKYSALILILLICSCKKEEFRTVIITGKVNNIGTFIPESGVLIVLIRSNSDDGRTQGIIARTITDSDGNYSLSHEISDAFSYTLKIEADENEYWLEKPDWGTSVEHNLEYNDSFDSRDFSISKKAEIDVDFNYSNVIDTNDRIVLRFYRPSGDAYWYNFISSPGPDIHTDLDLSDYYLGTTRDLFEGQQYLQCTFTNDGIDSVFNVNYNLIAGQTTVVTLDIFN